MLALHRPTLCAEDDIRGKGGARSKVSVSRMDYLYVRNDSQDKSFNSSNVTTDHDNTESVAYVVTSIITCVNLPLTLVAIYALYSQVRNDNVAPIFVINLFASDLVQLCCSIVWMSRHQLWIIKDHSFYIYKCGLMASVGFMTCIALERYLVIAFPLWYHFNRTIRKSVGVCVVVWALAPLYFLTVYFFVDSEVSETVYATLLLLPLPLFTFFLGGTLRALSASRVPSDEKRRIVGILVLVLLIYTLLFLPRTVRYLAVGPGSNDAFRKLSHAFLRLSPLADLVLYVFMRKGTVDKLLASVCCCRMDRSDVDTSAL